MSSPPDSSPHFQREPAFTLWLATFVALATLAGSLYLSIGMGLKACPLCYYQRTLVMGVVTILVMGMFIRDVPPSALSALALPLAAAGLFVAGWHEYLEVTEVLECPAGVLGVGTAPQQSLAALGLLTALLVLDLLRQRIAVAVIAGLVLGGFLAFSAIRSAVPPCPITTCPSMRTCAGSPTPRREVSLDSQTSANIHGLHRFQHRLAQAGRFGNRTPALCFLQICAICEICGFAPTLTSWKRQSSKNSKPR